MTSPFGLLRASLINNNPGMAQSKPKHDGPETDKKSTSAHRPSMRQLKDRWGDELVEAGWVGLPTTLLERQRALGLDAIDVTIILHIAKHWWDAGSLPFPSKRSIAQMMGIHPRTVAEANRRHGEGGPDRSNRTPGRTRLEGQSEFAIRSPWASGKGHPPSP